jgi:hypothetical protein
MLTVWFAVTCGAVNSPPLVIEPALALHTGVTGEVVLSLHEAVAAYVSLPVSGTVEGPAMERPVKTGGTSTIVTGCEAFCVTPPEVYEADTVTD